MSIRFCLKIVAYQDNTVEFESAVIARDNARLVIDSVTSSYSQSNFCKGRTCRRCIRKTTSILRDAEATFLSSCLGFHLSQATNITQSNS